MIIRRLTFFLVAVSSPSANAHAHDMERQEFDFLAKQCAPSVHPDTLAAIVNTESAFRPLAININGSQQLPRQPEHMAEAIATAEYLSANGYNFDVGLGQINSANVAAFGMTWANVFEPCTNLGAAARVLTDCFVRASNSEADQQSALRMALSCYNTGHFTHGDQNGYVARIERAAHLVPALVTSAFPPPNPGGDVAPDTFGTGRMDAFHRVQLRTRTNHAQREGVPINVFRLNVKPQTEENKISINQ